MPKLKIAQVGCGGMGLRHLYGQIESQRVFGTFDYAAVCDLNRSAADHVASEAEAGLGKRPAVYTDFDDMLDKEPGLDAVDIVTDAGLHHVLAIKAFEAGKHVAVEKPVAITVRAGLSMMKAAEKAGRVLSVSENYRRDPLNRLVKAILDARALGSPRMSVDMSLSGTRYMPHGTAWRHIKTRGGYMLDYAVHDADLLIYFLGAVDTVYAETRLWEKQRLVADPEADSMKGFYGHRVREDIELEGAVECTSEDMVSAVLRFESGVVGHFAKSAATPGRSTGGSTIYCDDGSIGLPGSRSGNPPSITRIGMSKDLDASELLSLAPSFKLDRLTARLFGGSKPISSYDLTFAEADRKLIALELEDFARAILDGTEPECTGQVGLDAVALTYAFLESGHIRQPVSFIDVAEDRVNAYQSEINEVVGLA